jgi:hypothetical protein
MNPYKSLGSAIGTRTALDLAQRLSAWHDAMVVHQRRAGSPGSDGCDGECPHSEAPLLWLEALDVYGERAHELGFLRTHADADRAGTGRTMEASL